MHGTMPRMDRSQLAAWLRLQHTPGVGNIGARALLKAFGEPAAIFEQAPETLAAYVSAAAARALQSVPTDANDTLTRTWNWLQAAPDRHRLLPLTDPQYPQTLLQIADPPVLLYAMGTAVHAMEHWLNQKETPCLAIVGSRNPTAQGATNAHRFAQTLADAELCIVSGLALGIDGMAHEGALACAAHHPLCTIAVVGTGLDRVYPRQHQTLAHHIAQRGLILSEYAIGTAPLPAHFPQRNRIIAGLACGTLVVEAALQSGSLITAQLAVDQGKDVFAIPGSIHSVQARGCHALIRQGAKLVECAHDVLEELRLPSTPSPPPRREASEPVASAQESALLQALGFDPVGLDAVQQRTGLPTPALQAALMELELQGTLARLPGGLYQRLARA